MLFLVFQTTHHFLRIYGSNDFLKKVDKNNVFCKIVSVSWLHQGSNIFIYGHSSSAIDSGPYSKIFVPLDKLQKNDEILVSYNNQEYNYQVVEKKIIDKNDVSVLKPTEKETLTLMTCWPIGTDQKRLIIRAELKS